MTDSFDDIVCQCGHSKIEHRDACVTSCMVYDCGCWLYVPNHDHPLFIDEEEIETDESPERANG